MFVELGHFALIMALAVALLQATVPLWGAHARHPQAMALAGPAANLQLVLVVIAYAALTWSFLVSDFSVKLVYDHSHSAMPFIYKLAGVWGNHEGSMLLWVFILALLGACVANFGGNLPTSLRARVLGVQSLIAFCFLAFLLFTSNPFIRLDPAPFEGRELNPLLQDPGLAFHPPFLYLGYVGFSIAFSFGAAALLEGRVDPAWARWVRPWTLLAWSALTLGIAMGSWWAYYELGWGGFWFWDPSENASLMPWLAGTALLHSAIVVEKRDTLKAWTILLAIAAFSTSLIGTFIIRSGLLTSVHSFANDPGRGVLLLMIWALLTGAAMALFALRAPAMRPGGAFQTVSRETALVLNNILLCVTLFVVMLGTFWPALVEVATGELVSVGPPYFNTVATPFFAALVLLMAVGTLMPWKRADLPVVLGRLKWAAVATLIAGALALWLRDGGPLLAPFAMMLGAWAVFGALADLFGRIKLFRAPPIQSWNRAVNLPRAMWGGTLAHAGLGVAIMGIVGVSLQTQEHVEVLQPGETIDIGRGAIVRLDGSREERIANYEALIADLTLVENGRETPLRPEERLYPVAGTQTTESATIRRGFSDVYAAIGGVRGENGLVIRVWRHPLVYLIWGGAIIMFVGGMVSLSDRRYRVGAPQRQKSRKRAAPDPAPAE